MRTAGIDVVVNGATENIGIAVGLGASGDVDLVADNESI